MREIIQYTENSLPARYLQIASEAGPENVIKLMKLKSRKFSVVCS